MKRFFPLKLNLMSHGKTASKSAGIKNQSKTARQVFVPEVSSQKQKKQVET